MTVRGADLNGTTTGYQYDAASRLQTIGHDLNGTANDLTLGFTYNPAGQIASSSRSNDAFALAAQSGTTTETPNGLNQLVGRDAATLTYDRRGNLTNDGAGTTYAYDSENRLVSRTANGATVALSYDPLGRLYSLTGGGATRRFLYDGHTLISEHDNSATPVLLQRYAHGPGVDEPVAYYQGDALGLVNRTYPHQDERGSVAAIATQTARLTPPTATTNMACPKGRWRAASAIPVRCGSRSSASITIAPACTDPNSAASSRPTRSAMATG